ncbi:MAG: hypothetical protein WBA28_01730 [Microbacteriaceae bacterium]
MIQKSPTKLVSLLAAGAISALLLTGCANPLEQFTQGGIENLIKDKIKQETGADVDFSIGDGAKVPASWPAQIPTPQGMKLTTAMASAETGWHLSYEMTAESQFESYISSLVKAGFVEENTTSLLEMANSILAGHGYSLVVSFLGKDGKGTLSIIATKTQ